MKYILRMAFRNIGRNKRRTILSAFAISVAVMVVLIMRGYVGGIMDSMFDSVIKITTGHIRIAHTKYLEKEDMMPLEYKIDGFDGGGYEQLIYSLESVQGVKVISPRIKFGVLLSYKGKSSSAMGLGIDPVSEKAIMSFDKVMIEGEYFGTDKDKRSIIIGSILADKLGIKTGDKITILARTAYDSLKGMTFDVVGIFRYGISALDDKMFYIPIGSAGKLLEMDNGVSEIIVMINKPENAEKTADKIKETFRNYNLDNNNAIYYDVIPWQQQGGYLGFMKSAQTSYNIAYLCLLILASTVIINTTMMVIYERIREIGTISALGMRSSQIVLLFTMESAIVSAIGSFIGTIIGGSVDFLLSKTGIDFNALSGGSLNLIVTDIIYPRFNFSILFQSFIFGVIVASAVAYIPARRSAKIEPVEALRSI